MMISEKKPPQFSICFPIIWAEHEMRDIRKDWKVKDTKKRPGKE